MSNCEGEKVWGIHSVVQGVQQEGVYVFASPLRGAS